MLNPSFLECSTFREDLTWDSFRGGTSIPLTVEFYRDPTISAIAAMILAAHRILMTRSVGYNKTSVLPGLVDL